MRFQAVAARGVGALGVLVFAGILWVSSAQADSSALDRFDVVVIDAGHGGEDRGARGAQGLIEKDLVLDVSLRLKRRLEASGLTVLLTRETDLYVPLEDRSARANDARADLFLSIHANSAERSAAKGFEVFFLSVDASDETAEQVAQRENSAFGSQAAVVAIGDPLVAVLGDMAVSEYMQESDAFAKLANDRLQDLPKSLSRGVKQAPFVVLMGVQMPSALVEIGFLSNPGEERALRADRRREEIARALTQAVVDFGKRYDALHGAEVRWDAANRSD